MKTITPVFVFNSLDIVRGGLTKAVLTRANTLIKHYDNVVFLTLKFQPNFKEIVRKLYETGKLDSRIKVLNFFDDVIPNNGSQEPAKTALHSIKEDNLIEFRDQSAELPSYRYYQNGIYVKYKRFTEDGRLMFIDYMDKSRYRLQRDEFDEEGYLVCSQFMDYIKNTPRLKCYYSRDGKCYITVWVNPDTKKEGRTLYFGEQPKEYKSLYDFYTVWVEEKLKLIQNPIVMSDSRFTDGLVLNVDVPHGKKVAILHNNHFEKPYDRTAHVKKTWAPFFNGLERFDRIVFLTEDQMKDVSEQFGPLKSYKVIPHAANPVVLEEDEKDYNPHLAVALARYESQKRLDEAIKAFKYVVNKIPDAEFHIYGFGPKREKLEELIKELDLEKNVKLQGFTSNPSNVLQTAACSVLTSDYEGFGMVLTESLAVGTPVVSYDCKYGPKDIIRDGVDGYIVPKGDKKKLAQQIIKIMTDRGLRERLSKNAREVLERFSVKNYEKQWVELLNGIFNDDDLDQEIINITFSLGNIEVRSDSLYISIWTNKINKEQERSLSFEMLVVNRNTLQQKVYKCSLSNYEIKQEIPLKTFDNEGTWDIYIRYTNGKEIRKKHIECKNNVSKIVSAKKYHLYSINPYQTDKGNFSINVKKVLDGNTNNTKPFVKRLYDLLRK